MPRLPKITIVANGILAFTLLLGGGAINAAPELMAGFEEHPGSLLAIREDGSRSPGQARIDEEHAHTGTRSLRVDYNLPRRGGAVELAPFPVSPEHIPDEPWGIEFWCRTAQPHSLMFDIRLMEQSGEPWEAAVPFSAFTEDEEQWHRVRIPFGWFRIISWERRDGRLTIDELDTISISIRGAANEPQDGTIWLDSVRIVDADQTIPSGTIDEDGFLPLHLDNVFDSDAIAWRTNPTDGDFHTGDWEPRTLPAEYFPNEEVAPFAGIPFRTPPLADGANNHIRSNGQVVTGFPIEEYTTAYVLASGKFGDQMGDVTLHFADGSHERVALRISDWSMTPQFGESVGLLLPYAYHRHNLDQHRNPRLFVQSLRIDPTRRLERIGLPNNDFLKVFGITLSTHDDPPRVGEFAGMPLAELDPRLHMADRDTIDFTEPVRPVGVLGGYVVRRSGSYGLDIPTFNGFLTFVADARHLPQGLLEWHRFQNRTFRLGGVEVPSDQNVTGEVEFMDSVTQRYFCETIRGEETVPFSMYVSRAWPASLYQIAGDSFAWIDAPERTQLHAAVPTPDGIGIVALTDGAEVPIPAEPWILLWHRVPEDIDSERQERDFASPILLVPERRPTSIVAGRTRGPFPARLDFQFDGPAGRVAAMTLNGIRQTPARETRLWADEAIPPSVIEDARTWSRRLQRFPMAPHQEFSIDEAAGFVTIRDHFDWIGMESEWEVEPSPFTPLPPTVILAHDNGLKVQLPEDIVRSDVSTFYGPLAGREDFYSTYAIPISPHVSSMLVFTDATGLPLLDDVKTRLAARIGEIVPDDLENHISISDISQDVAQLRLVAASRLILGPDEQREAYSRSVIENAFRDYNLKLEKEPQTAQYYLMDDRFWAKDALYDKEWSIGFILQGLWSHAYYHNDWAIIAKHWNEIRGLYRYYQLHFDWATNSTFTMTTGVGANSDGIRIAYEGMLAMARISGMAGDETAREDAVIRSARQRLSMYASWFGPQWAADHDYVMEQYRHVAPEDAELRFSPDHLWVEYFTTNVSHTSDFFQTNHAFFVFNLAHLMFLHDTSIAESRLRSWIFETIPELHPNWCDGNARPPWGGRFYGDAHAMSLLIARAILFEDTLEDTLECVRMATEGTSVMDQWYGPHGLVPYVLAASLTGSAPRVVAPVQTFDVRENTYDHATGLQHIVMLAMRDGHDVLRIRCHSAPPESVTINGEPADFQYDETSRYAVIPLRAVQGGTSRVAIHHRRP